MTDLRKECKKCGNLTGALHLFKDSQGNNSCNGCFYQTELLLGNYPKIKEYGGRWK